MRTSRQAYIDRQVMRALIGCGDWLLPEQALFEQLSVVVAPPLQRAELDGSLRHLEGERRIRRVDTEHGPKWRVTDLGRDWYETQLTGG